MKYELLDRLAKVQGTLADVLNASTTDLTLGEATIIGLQVRSMLIKTGHLLDKTETWQRNNLLRDTDRVIDRFNTPIKTALNDECPVCSLTGHGPLCKAHQGRTQD